MALSPSGMDFAFSGRHARTAQRQRSEGDNTGGWRKISLPGRLTRRSSISDRNTAARNPRCNLAPTRSHTGKP